MQALSLMFALFVLPLQTIKFGRLESIFTGFFQPAMIIGIILFVLGIFVYFFPGARKFLGGLIGSR